MISYLQKAYKQIENGYWVKEQIQIFSKVSKK